MPQRNQSRGVNTVVSGDGKRKKTDDDIADAVVVDDKGGPEDKVEQRLSGGRNNEDNVRDTGTDTAGKVHGQNQHQNHHHHHQQQQSSSGSEAGSESKFDVRQRVIARDEDGLMYFSDIRRKMYGVNHQQNQSALQTIGKGAAIFDKDNNVDNSHNDDETNDDDGQRRPQWMYFVHYEGWKTLWDRWYV